jgi:hypothetical protein
MDIRQPPKLKTITAEVPVELVEEVDLVVEYLEEARGMDADRDRVVEHIIREHLKSGRQDAKAFREKRQEK